MKLFKKTLIIVFGLVFALGLTACSNGFETPEGTDIEDAFQSTSWLKGTWKVTESTEVKGNVPKFILEAVEEPDSYTRTVIIDSDSLAESYANTLNDTYESFKAAEKEIKDGLEGVPTAKLKNYVCYAVVNDTNDKIEIASIATISVALNKISIRTSEVWEKQ